MIKHKGNEIKFDKNNNIKVLPQGELNKIIRYLKICNGEVNEVCKYVNLSQNNIELIKLLKKDRLMKNKAKFTPKEDELLMNYILNYGLNFKKFSRVFKKTASDLKWRYQKIQTLNKIFNFQEMQKESPYSNIIDSILYDDFNINKEYNRNGNVDDGKGDDVISNSQDNERINIKEKEVNHKNSNTNENYIDNNHNLNNINNINNIYNDNGINIEDNSSKNSFTSIETFQQKKFQKERKKKEIDENFIYKTRKNENLMKSLTKIEEKINSSYENLLEINRKYNNNLSEEMFYIKDDMKRSIFQEKWEYIDVVDGKINDLIKKFKSDRKEVCFIDDLLCRIRIILSIIRLIMYKEKLYSV